MEKNELKKILNALPVPLLLTLIAWGVFFLDRAENDGWYKWGVFPRTAEGLKGILFMPFLHDINDFSHIINNSLPFMFMGWALFYFYRGIAWKVLLFVWMAGGLWVWMFANPAYHIGLSGVLYGLAFFLFFSGVFRRDKQLMALTLLVTFLYGSMIWGIFPYDIRISWQSHLFGALSGIIAAFYYKKSVPSNVEPPPPPLEDEDYGDDEFWKIPEENQPEEPPKINYIYIPDGKKKE